MAETRTWKPAGKPYISAPAATAHAVSAGTRMEMEAVPASAPSLPHRREWRDD